jgi:DNA-binding SARP family transcriptional activator
MRFAVLGPLEVTDDGEQQVDVGGRQPRLVLAALVAANGRPVSAGALIEVVWGDEPPASAAGTLQSYVSRLRRALEAGGGPALRYDEAGYRLELRAEDETDVARFDELAAAGQAHLAAGDASAARDALTAALDLWRGPALVELVDHGSAIAHAAELEERRLAVLEERLDADLALGRHAHLVGELQGLVADHPLREGLHAKLALALYRSGRQADALRALAQAGTMLREELGLEPSPVLRDLDAAILTHVRSLEAPAPTPTAPPPASSAPATPADVTARDRASPFVGREIELGELLAGLKEAVEDARFVVLEGDPGIGKTRLADELARVASAEGSLTVWGRSNECGAAPALWPWLSVLRAVAPVVDDVPATLGEVLAGTSPLLARQGAAVQFERFDAIATVLERAATTTGAPVVVLLDDLQWADEASLDLLQFLTTRLDRGVLVVAIVRPLAIGQADPVTHALAAIARRHGQRRLRLRGLSATATGELLDALAPEPVGPDLSARIHERAEGNPFYAIELARLLDEDADAERAVPASVRDAVRRRLGRLTDDTLEVLTVAAVTGRDIYLPVLARATACDPGRCLDLLDPAAAQQLLVESPEVPGSLRFNHALVREVLLDGLTPARRARLHLQVADAITEAAGGSPDEDGDQAVGRDDVEVLAEHLWQAVSLGVGARAAAALERAAEMAISRVAYAAAEDSLTRAAQLRRAASNSPDELTTLLRLLEVMQATRYFSGTDREVLGRAQELAQQLGLEDSLRKLQWSEWAALSTSGRIAEAEPMAQSYFARWCDDPRPHVASAAHACFGVDQSTRGCFASAVEHLDRAAGLLDGLPPPDDAFEQEHRLVAHAFGLFSHAAHGSMSPEEALGGFDFLLAVVPPVAVPAVCAFGGAVASVHARWDALDELVRRALDADPAAQFAFFGGQLMMFQGLVAAARGDLDEGLATFDEARTRYRAVGGRVATGSYQALLGELAARAGRVNEAAEVVAGARRQNDETGEGWNDVTIGIAEAAVAHAAGDPARAAERMGAAIARGHEQEAHGLVRRAQSVASDLGIALDGRP